MVSNKDFIEQEIDSKFIFTHYCSIKEGTRFFLRLPAVLLSGKEVQYQFFFRREDEEWEVPHPHRAIRVGDLPYRHKSRPVDRMINYARSSNGFRMEDAGKLLRLMAEDFHASVGWYPEGWMLCTKPYISIDLWSMDKHIGQWRKDSDEPHPFLTRTELRAA